MSIRVAAYYGDHKYTTAVHDCANAIEINPKYAEAQSDFGHTSLDQGNLIDALCHGFVKGWFWFDSNWAMNSFNSIWYSS